MREKFGIYFTGTALTLIIFAAIGLLVLVMIKGLGVFWQKELKLFTLKDGSEILGELIQKDLDNQNEDIVQIKIANRDLVAIDYRWVKLSDILSTTLPKNAILIERTENGNFFGFFKQTNEELLEEKFVEFNNKKMIFLGLQKEWQIISDNFEEINKEIYEKTNQVKTLLYNGLDITSFEITVLNSEIAKLQEAASQLLEKFDSVSKKKSAIKLDFLTADKMKVTIPLENIVNVLLPNQMSTLDKIVNYVQKFWILLSDEPREANTEGGIYPAIFGTILMVFLMSILCFPLGVIAAIYLNEYAKEGILLNLARIAVNNLAGVPSIVYGIFGLGFFIYGIGGAIDRSFFGEFLPTPTFGTGGILWASLTLGLLTAPVVIVSTEEALSAVPQGIRKASYALGANKLQTLIRVVLPLASPGMLTGFILAIARAAGEVSPLMITGVVKLAPSLPIDSEFPFIHLDRKFMHLGFHIFDLGFQSPNIENAKPMVYMTTFLLIVVVILLSGTTIYIRNKMTKKYAITNI